MLIGALLMGPLALFSFGLVSFTALLYLWFKETRRGSRSRVDILNGLMLALSAVWFIVNLVVEFGPIEWTGWAMAMAFLFPPLVLDLFVSEAAYRTKFFHRLVKGVYVVSVCGATAAAYLMLEGPISGTSLEFWCLFGGMALLFGVAGGGSIFVLSRAPSAETSATREAARMNVALLIAMVLTVGGLIGLQLFGERWLEAFWPYVFLIPRSMPLLFLFFNSYYEQSFWFFDVFIKRATYFFLALVILVGHFSLLTRVIEVFQPASRLHPWIYALSLVPWLMLAPYLWDVLESFLDRSWLGRRSSSLEAVDEFLREVRSARSRRELIGGTERALQRLFQTDARVVFEGEEKIGFQPELRVPLRGLESEKGEVCLGPRPNAVPYFGADRVLVEAVTEVLSHLLHSLRLQEELREQEKKKQELALEAGQARLQALRAQINPHFLFNALNSIASLTHMDPDRAEQTVERLAEIFRYTLTRSQTEWVALGDEIEFIRSYLAVEKVRFGSRLVVRMHVDKNLEECRVPAMLLQTLVENAIKHGVSQLRGKGVIRLTVRRNGNRLGVEVADNGPGLDPAGSEERLGMGFGLSSLLSRLTGYYGDRATFRLYRDDEQGWTLARVEIPLNEVSRAGGPVA